MRIGEKNEKKKKKKKTEQKKNPFSYPPIPPEADCFLVNERTKKTSHTSLIG